MKLKKMVSVFAAASIVLGTAALPANAQKVTKVTYENFEDFEGYSGSGAPNGWTAWGNTAPIEGTENWGEFTPNISSCDGKQGTGAKVTLEANQYRGGIKRTLTKCTTKQNQFIEFDAKAESDGSFPTVFLKDTVSEDGARESVITFANGKIAQGTNIGAAYAKIGEYTAKSGEWQHIKLGIDGLNDTLCVWVDGELAVKDRIIDKWAGAKSSRDNATELAYKIPNRISQAESVMLGVYQQGSVSFDNVKVYKQDITTSAGSNIFFTDFSDMKQGDFSVLPNGFAVPIDYFGVGSGKVDEDHGTSLALDVKAGAGINYVLDKAVESGKVVFEYDVYKESNSNFTVWPRSWNIGIEGLRAGWEEDWHFVDSKNEADVGKWRHFKTVYDMDSDKAEFYVDDNLIKTVTGYTKSLFSLQLMATDNATADTTNGTGKIYIDNFSCTVEKNAAEEYSYEENFDSKTKWDDMWPEASGHWLWKGLDKGSLTFDGSFGYKITADGGFASFEKVTPDISEGEMSVEYKMQQNGNTTMLIIDGDNYTPVYTARNISGEASYINPFTWDATPAADNALSLSTGYVDGWIYIKLNFDMTNKKMTVATSTDGVTYTASNKGTIPDAISKISGLRFQMNGNTDRFWKIDDMKIKVTSQPMTETPTVAFYGTDGNVINSTSSIIPAVSKIVVNYGAEMMPSTLEKGITLKASNGNAVDFMISTDEKDVVLALDKLLLPNKTYTLGVAQSVKSAKGESVKAAYELEFLTGDGAVKGESFAADKSAIGDIKGGADLKLSHKLVNTSGKALENRLIISWYNSGAMVATRYFDLPVDSFVADADFEYNLKLGEQAEADCFKAFLWSGESGMIPIANSVVID